MSFEMPSSAVDGKKLRPTFVHIMSKSNDQNENHHHRIQNRSFDGPFAGGRLHTSDDNTIDYGDPVCVRACIAMYNGLMLQHTHTHGTK